MARTKSGKRKRMCLIVERLDWETGAAEQQLQIPIPLANRFFGSGNRTLPIKVRVRIAGRRTNEFECSVSKRYPNATRRINGLPLLGQLKSCFIFFSETQTHGVYDVWWQYDKAVVAAKYSDWYQAPLKRSTGKSSQSRTRLAKIVDGGVPSPVLHIT